MVTSAKSPAQFRVGKPQFFTADVHGNLPGGDRVPHPLLAPDLLAAGNFILTPHVAWSSREAMQALADQLIDNIEAFAAGQPRNQLA